MYKLNILLLLYCLSTIAVFADRSALPNTPFCEVREPIYGHSYNFTKLTDPSTDIVIVDEYPNEVIRMQLCSPLKETCNGKDGYAICLIKNKTEKGLGKMPPKVINESGKVIFVFTGDDCTPHEKYTVNVIMKCDYLATNYSYPEVFFHTDEQCNLFMIWRTALACGPRIQQNCTATDGGVHYDLSPLTRYSENYVIHMGYNTSPKIILNVCHSVIFEYNALCEMHSGACLRDSTKVSKSGDTNLGDVIKPPFVEDGKLTLEYQEGSMCTVRNVTNTSIRTTISFICDFEAMDTLPEYVGGSEECHYQLIWKTAAACSVESLRDRRGNSPGNCTVINPLTNFTYNLQPFKNKDFQAISQNGTKYDFGVCGPPSNTRCKSGTGVCYTKNGTSMGISNTNLMWQEGGPYLNYTDGDPCGNGQQRYTVIAFVCGPEDSNDTIHVMEEHSCQLIIHWNTHLVCEKRVICATDDDEIHLSALISSTNNYIVKVNSTEFHINICRPLVPTPGLTCAHGSAVCKAYLSSNDFVNETSLGFPRESPIVNKDRQAELHYFGGSPCPEDPSRNISSTFTFPCLYNTKGLPEFKKYEDCNYSFEWKTRLTCGAALGNWTSPCVIRDPLLSRECDLSLLHKDGRTHRVKSKQGTEYVINICGGRKYCNGSAVCQGVNGFGSLGDVIFDYSKDIIILQYRNGSKCINSSYTSEVRFTCNESVGIGAPELLWEWKCFAVFVWHTNVTCPCRSTSPQPVHTLDKHENVQNYTPRYAGTVAGLILTVIALLAALLYFRDPDKRACLRSCLNPFTSRNGGGRVQYCRVNTTEGARLLLDADPTQCQTDSDDDLLNA